MITKTPECVDHAPADINGFEESGLPIALAQKLLAEILRAHFDIDMALLKPDSLLEDVGLDSLEMVNLGLVLEKWHDLNIDTAALGRTQTLGELTTLIAQWIGRG